MFQGLTGNQRTLRRVMSTSSQQLDMFWTILMIIGIQVMSRFVAIKYFYVQVSINWQVPKLPNIILHLALLIISIKKMLSEVEQIIRHYGLEPHMEGGYFKQTYRSPLMHNKPTEEKSQTSTQKRNLMTVIYYLIRKQQPYAVWHSNKSDIVHFHLRGGSLVYDMISPEGEHQRLVLGQDFKNGETHSFLCKGGYHKATTLLNGDYGLLGEAVAPGFEYKDQTTFTEEQMCEKFPHLKQAILRNELNIQNNKRHKQLKM